MSFQVCPKCSGQKYVATPPYFAGDLMMGVASGANLWPCPICNATGLIDAMTGKPPIAAPADPSERVILEHGTEA